MSEPTTQEQGTSAPAARAEPRPTTAPTSDAAPKRRPITVTCDRR